MAARGRAKGRRRRAGCRWGRERRFEIRRRRRRGRAGAGRLRACRRRVGEYDVRHATGRGPSGGVDDARERPGRGVGGERVAREETNVAVRDDLHRCAAALGNDVQAPRQTDTADHWRMAEALGDLGCMPGCPGRTTRRSQTGWNSAEAGARRTRRCKAARSCQGGR